MSPRKPVVNVMIAALLSGPVAASVMIAKFASSCGPHTSELRDHDTSVAFGSDIFWQPSRDGNQMSEPGHESLIRRSAPSANGPRKRIAP